MAVVAAGVRKRLCARGIGLLAVGTCRVTSAHIGERVFPVFEIPSRDLPELHDNSLQDWEVALPLSHLQTDDFDLEQGERDLEDLAFRVFLAWNDRSQRLFAAVEVIDDVYMTGDEGTAGDEVRLFVDGDHSGGIFNYYLDDKQSFHLPYEGVTESEVQRLQGSQAQGYILHPETARHVPGFTNPATAWSAVSPWTDVGSSWIGDQPAMVLLEVEITPWDELSAEGPDSSRRSALKAGAVLGLELVVWDVDLDDVTSDGRAIPTIYSLGEQLVSYTRSEGFVDAELVPCHVSDCSGSPETGVRADSWGRVKASFR